MLVMAAAEPLMKCRRVIGLKIFFVEQSSDDAAFLAIQPQNGSCSPLF